MHGRTILGYEATVIGLHGEPAAILFKCHASAIASFDRLLIAMALREGSQLLQKGQKLFINIHPRTLSSGLALPEVDRSADIVFEITEKTNFSGEVKQELRELQQLGFGLAIDDYGKQFSNLDRLISDWFSPRYLKLDRSFTAALLQVERAQWVIRHTQELCNKLGIHLIAEGVEMARQQDLLQQLGVRYMQGYHLGYPEAAENWLGQRVGGSR
ncbi:putative EAL domain-containing protein [Paenibacillus agaridevorans]|uniref:Putative EAL domain-containing protein n=2 Tax=Paenibacillus agaridevorans TaxID=171404 RepID=A0A2R5EWB1_9BACL|nr:putative EAL domain-containing protein [Paenibacillus agaridevorans]